MAEHNAEIYKKAFEIAVRCARELNGTPELKEAYQEAQKDNRALQSFMDFCLEKAVEESPEHTDADAVEVVRCKDCKHCFHGPKILAGLVDGVYVCGIWGRGLPHMKSDDFCSYGGERENEKAGYDNTRTDGRIELLLGIP